MDILVSGSKSSLVYLLQSIHIQTNSSPNHSFIYLFILWNEKEGCFILLPDHWKKNYICNAVVPCLNQDSGEVQMGEV